jgi:uncharacterized protein (DUF1015 family)
VQTHFPPDAGSGLVLEPFRGVRYAHARAGGLANVTSPPYDVIGPGTLQRLLAASPYNIVRLILPALDPASPGAGPAGPPARGDARAAGEIAAARLHDWLADGVLATDDEPTLYVYEQRGPGFVQRGLIGLVSVGTAAIHPHEDVMAGPVAGRRELMAITRSNLEPILLVYNDEAGAGGHGGSAGTSVDSAVSASEATRLVDLTADERAPLACAVTDDGVSHRLWALTDPAEQAAIAADLARRTALIADGHHRYAAYGELREQMRAGGLGDGPWDFGLAFLVDANAYPLTLGPIHRVIPGLDPGTAARLAARAFTVTRLPGLDQPGTTRRDDDAEARKASADSAVDGWAERVPDALRVLAEAGRDGTAFLLAGADGFALISRPDADEVAAAMPTDASERWRALDAAVMQELLLARLWSIEDNVRDVLISHDAEEAVRLAAQTGGTAVLCNPMGLATVMNLAAHGERVPRKSTSFGPKPRTGLVLRTFE